jgi:3-methyl-2-oxobutanoate hydroxymethyltransferase
MKKITISRLQQLKQHGEKFAVLTAYDSSFAQIISDQGIECILVGDSLGMVVQGHQSTVSVTIEDMCYHTRCVSKVQPHSFIIADMPYMSFSDTKLAIENAALLMQAGAQMVKLEGGTWLNDTIAKMTERGIPVCAHLGLMPQSVDAIGGFKVQAKSEQDAEHLIQEALAIEKAGAKLLVLECIPKRLASKVSKLLTIPVIGIGAGNGTDAQVLVLQDMLGMNADYFQPKFVKNFMQDAASISEAISNFSCAVKSGEFPNDDQSFLGE